MKFADQLKHERERLGLTQAGAAALLDVPARTYWEWEAEKTTPYAITQEGALRRLSTTKKRPK
jgi:DNA-binding XRE family transcriptional regulator